MRDNIVDHAAGVGKVIVGCEIHVIGNADDCFELTMDSQFTPPTPKKKGLDSRERVKAISGDTTYCQNNWQYV
ncbi:MAG: hypothetical protein JKX85_00615 [Phycisphaeraceae bacterium]|nr:hypothetical protein [Phycisphaeraceae bacterium]